MTLVEVRELTVRFPVRGALRSRVAPAVNGVSFAIEKGETLGLVGETGCGKSTLAKLVVRLIEPTQGSIRYDGTDITRLSTRGLRPFRKRMQIVFQDPYGSLNPRLRVRAHLAEALRLHGIVPRSEIDARIDRLLEQVGLAPEHGAHFPHAFSGGQRQRIAIARALAVEPEFLVADEPLSALDVSLQAQILNLLLDLKETLGLTLLFVSHDLDVVEHVSDRVLVMVGGHVVEELDNTDLRTRARHPYTLALLGARAAGRAGSTAAASRDRSSLREAALGCPYAARCPLVMERCRIEMPALEARGPRQRVACFAVDRAPP